MLWRNRAQLNPRIDSRGVTPLGQMTSSHHPQTNQLQRRNSSMPERTQLDIFTRCHTVLPAKPTSASRGEPLEVPKYPLYILRSVRGHRPRSLAHRTPRITPLATCSPLTHPRARAAPAPPRIARNAHTLRYPASPRNEERSQHNATPRGSPLPATVRANVTYVRYVVGEKSVCSGRFQTRNLS